MTKVFEASYWILTLTDNRVVAMYISICFYQGQHFIEMMLTVVIFSCQSFIIEQARTLMV